MESLQASVVNGNWNRHDNKPCWPKFLYQVFVKLMHGQDLVSKGQMQTDTNRYWLTQGFSTYDQNSCQKCFVSRILRLLIHLQSPPSWSKLFTLNLGFWAD